MPDSFAWAVDDLVDLLKHADMLEVLRGFGKGMAREDPVVHFYETFLAAYDPGLRKVRGVYFTPEPVVRYIVRSLDHLLATRFDRSRGLADERTFVLDFAAGTGTFLYSVIDLIHERFARQAGAWNGYVASNLLHRLSGFELLMAPYAVAHLKLGLQLQATGYRFESEQRLGVYLTNTLEHTARQTELRFAEFLAREADAAAAIKDRPVLEVVLGNPPYAGHSANNGAWIRDLLHGHDPDGKSPGNYFACDGRPLGERNPKWLNDDYVKFIRFAQWRIEKTGSGVVGVITNHSYLDNPTFRGMRQSLLQSFDEIYIYDLHGNTKKRETCPDGAKDENVFDIQQGVAIALLVKHPTPQAPRVYHADLWGARGAKYDRLAATDVAQTAWRELKPVSPNYLFVPQRGRHRGEYERWWSLPAAMPTNVLGFQSHRDHFALDFDRGALEARITELRDPAIGDAELRRKFSITDTRDWRLTEARARLRADAHWPSLLVKCAYRPFDLRYAYYSEVAIERPRRELVAHLLGKKNLALNTVRQTKASTWQHAMVSSLPTPAVFVEIKDGSNVFPLYLYDDPAPEPRRRGSGGAKAFLALFEPATDYSSRRANFAPEFIRDLTARLNLKWLGVDHGDLKQTVGPEDVFHYAYAVFHAPTYRRRYAEHLRVDFPRLPLTSDVRLFRALAARGGELVALHLVESPKLDEFITEFTVRGDNVVESVRYTEADRRVWINQTQYFGSVPPPVWAFQVGGYQVCAKWLKDRKGRALSYDDLQHYQKIVVALSETMRLMAEIDTQIVAHGGWPAAFAEDGKR